MNASLERMGVLRFASLLQILSFLINRCIAHFADDWGGGVTNLVIFCVRHKCMTPCRKIANSLKPGRMQGAATAANAAPRNGSH